MSREKHIDIPAHVETIIEDIITIHYYLSVGRVTAVVATGSVIDGEFIADRSIKTRSCPIDEGDYDDLVKDKPDKQFSVDDLWFYIDRIDADGHKRKQTENMESTT